MREALVALMGKEALDGEQDNVAYSDDNVCRDYLCGLCPYDLFMNTKSDVGTCNKIHSESLKADYEKDFREGKVDYLPCHLRNIRRIVDDCDRKAHSMKRRLEETVKSPRVMALMDELQRNRDDTAEVVARLEQLGKKGRMLAALVLLEELDRLHSSRGLIENELKYLTNDPTNSGYQRLKICNVCAAYLSSIDSDRRLADHFIGKTHMGFRKLRDEIERLAPMVASRGYRQAHSRDSSVSRYGRRSSELRYEHSGDKKRHRDYDRWDHRKSSREDYRHRRDWNRESRY